MSSDVHFCWFFQCFSSSLMDLLIYGSMHRWMCICSCRWLEHVYMHMFSCIEMHMLIYVNTDRIAYLCACLSPSMYTCIRSRALWYIYSYIQTCICSSRVEPCTHSCSHIWTLMLTYIHTYICTCIHMCTLVHTWVNAHIWHLVRKVMYS